MPALKILHTAQLSGDLRQLADDLENIVLSGLEATGERAEVVFAVADLVHYGTGAYVELICRARPGRTAERMKSLAGQIHDRLAPALDVPEPKVRIRILLIDDDHAFGVN